MVQLKSIERCLGTKRLGASETWVWTGVSEEFGSVQPFRLQFDAEGRFHRSSEGPLSVTTLYDGERGWRTDWSGMSVPLELATLEQELIEVWIMTGCWLGRPQSFEVLEEAENSGSNDELTLVLRLTEGVQKVHLVIQRETSLPQRLEYNGVAGKIVVQFEQYEKHDGLSLPHRITRTLGGHVQRVQTVEHVSVSKDASREATLYSTPPALPEDTTFSGPAGDVPIRFAPTGHVLVRPKVNDEEVDWFIFDTGAGNSGVGRKTSASTGMPQVGTSLVASIFGTEEAPLLRGESLELGPVRLARPTFFSMDMTPIESAFGEPVGGIVGFDLLSRCVVELDLSEQQLTLHEPATFKLTEGAWQELWFQDNHPIVSAEFGGRSGLFRLDIGAAGGPHGNIVFHEPAVRQHRMVGEAETETMQLGSQNVALGTLDSFELAGKRFEGLEVVFALDESGLFADVHTAGNVGVGILSSFRIIFDYAHKRICLISKL